MHDWMNDPRPLHEVLEDWGEMHQMTKQEIADNLCVSIHSIYNWVSSHRAPAHDMMIRKLMCFIDRYAAEEQK